MHTDDSDVHLHYFIVQFEPKSRGEPHGSEDPQGVVLESDGGLQGCSDDTSLRERKLHHFPNMEFSTLRSSRPVPVKSSTLAVRKL